MRGRLFLSAFKSPKTSFNILYLLIFLIIRTHFVKYGSQDRLTEVNRNYLSKVGKNRDEMQDLRNQKEQIKRPLYICQQKIFIIPPQICSRGFSSKRSPNFELGFQHTRRLPELIQRNWNRPTVDWENYGKGLINPRKRISCLNNKVDYQESKNCHSLSKMLFIKKLNERVDNK